MTSSSVAENMPAGRRWRSHRWAAWLLRALIFLAPWSAAVVTSLWLAPRLYEPNGALEVIGWWLVLVSASSAVAWVVDRAARRLMPLTAMLKMTLLFPDRAPSRFRMALRRSDLGELRRRVAAARDDGSDRAEVAELMLSLANALNRYDRRLRGHGERTRAYADMLAEEMKIPEEDRDKLRWAALLHDVGKVEIPVEILSKDGPLDASERAIVRRHPLIGMRVAAPLVPWLGDWSRAIEDHHEWWDGSGYPRGLKGEEISLGARIVAVADAFDVMTSGRSYQAAQSPAAARREIAQMAGQQFDPAVARALMNVSLGRLRWMIGPVTWLGQIPFFLDRLGRDFITVTSAAALTAATIVSSIPYPSFEPPGTLAMAEISTTTQEAQPATRDTSARGVPDPSPSPSNPTTSTPSPESTSTSAVAASPTDATDPTDTGTSTPAEPGQNGEPGPGVDSDQPVSDPTTTTTTAPTTTVAPTTTAPPPAASSHDDVASTMEERAVTVDVVGNDSPGMNVDAVTSPPSRGTASVASGQVRYQPETNFHGTDTFEYRACHADRGCDTATVAVRVTPVNDPPSARNDSASTRAGESIQIPVLDNDRDIDGDALRVGAVGSPRGGKVSTDGTRVTYTAAAGFDGTDSFTYRACDPSGECAEATVTVRVEPVPRPPQAADDTAFFHPGGKPGSVNVLANDTSPDGRPLTVTITQGPRRGEILSVNGGTVTYRMEKGRPDDDRFIYRVCDDRGLCDTATVTLVKGP